MGERPEKYFSGSQPKIDRIAVGLTRDAAHPDDWYFCSEGVIRTDVTQIGPYETEWFYVKEGRLDTTTAPQLEGELATALDGITDLIFDLADLDYISSAGLRVLLSAQKKMNKQGSMIVRRSKPEIMESFDVTGFTDILTLED